MPGNWMSVEILSLCGLSAVEAERAAAAKVDIETGPDRLEMLLVLDDLARLGEHIDVYRQIDTAHRVYKLLCVTVGPRPKDELKLEFPGNLGGVQGSPVLWVSRPAGVDWAVTKSLVANRHPGFVATTVDRHPLIGLLAVEEIFLRVHEALLDKVPGRVASPGLWLAGGDDEAATFAGALAVAIQRVCEPGSAPYASFAELRPDQVGGARLAEAGPVDRYLGRVGELDRAAAHAIGRRTGLGGVLGGGGSEAQDHVVRVGEALTDMRDLVDHVLRDANVAGGIGELKDNQKALLHGAGLEFEAQGMPHPVMQTAASAAAQSPVYRAVASAIRGGDSIPSVGERLIATEREVGRVGSAAYRPQVEARCPSGLLAVLAAPQKVPRRASAAQVRRELGLEGAVTAARGLADLIVGVANREWSPSSVTSSELVRAKAALDGTRKALTAFASEAGGTRGGVRGGRLTRLGESLVPVLRDLILHALAVELASPSASGPEALRAGRERADAMLKEWTDMVAAHGVAARPSFAGTGAHDSPYAIEDDVTRIRDALLYPVRGEMWQLCAPADLSALDVDAPTLSIRLASRLAKDVLGVLPGDEPVWTSSGKFAGILRLVPLRAGMAESSWSKTDLPEEP